ncbi:FAS1 domain-containing protein [Cadophora sp. DSE1049]|nr:FAS1 domain-containing protein [Cadophora sp. DSE1049]
MLLLCELHVILCVFSLPITVQAQSFLSAISAYPQLSNFTNLLSTDPALASSLFSYSATAPQTVLVPDDNAFLSFRQATGQTFPSISQNNSLPVLQYHMLSGLFTQKSFADPDGLTAPTGLRGPTYNNRSAGAALSSLGATTANQDGQVVFIAPNASISPDLYVQSGRGRRVNLTAIDQVWDGGRLHTVDGFFTLPDTCTKTIRAWSLFSLDAALNRTGLSSILDHANNVTCLGPSDQAFLNAGSPDVKANVSALANALMFHTIPQPLYTNFLTDGQTFKSLSNATVRVTRKNGDIYFNDAKLTRSNVITNNGLMHILDRVMSPLQDEGSQQSTSTGLSTTSATSTGPSSATRTTTASSSGSATATGATSAASFLAVQPPAWRFLGALVVVSSYVLMIVA